MKPTVKMFNHAWFAAGCILLASCGGGSGSSVTPVSQISGTVAAGAVMDSGTVTVYDATGTVVADNVPINSDGTYTASNIPSTAVPPFTLKASGTIGAAAATLYALAPNSSIVNITPVSHAMAANLANGDPATLTAGTSVTASAINDLDQSYQTALSNVTDATGATGSLLTSAYTAAHDAALDNLSLNT